MVYLGTSVAWPQINQVCYLLYIYIYIYIYIYPLPQGRGRGPVSIRGGGKALQGSERGAMGSKSPPCILEPLFSLLGMVLRTPVSFQDSLSPYAIALLGVAQGASRPEAIRGTTPGGFHHCLGVSPLAHERGFGLERMSPHAWMLVWKIAASVCPSQWPISISKQQSNNVRTAVCPHAAGMRLPKAANTLNST